MQRRRLEGALVNLKGSRVRQSHFRRVERHRRVSRGPNSGEHKKGDAAERWIVGFDEASVLGFADGRPGSSPEGVDVSHGPTLGIDEAEMTLID